MSEIITDTITGKSTATTITIGSTPVVSASANSMTIRGEGTAQTSIQQGLAKCWVTHPHDDVVDDSFNLSSLTDSATGRYVCNFTNNMASTKYIVPATGASYGSSNHRGGDFVGMDMDAGSTDSRSTSACNNANKAGSNSSEDASLVDRDWTMHIFFGDLA